MSTRDDAVQAILHAYLQAVDRGEKPDRQKILEAHPELRKDLAEFFADASKLEGMAKALRTVSLSDGNDSPGTDGVKLARIRYFGDYELIEELARGGMGVVFKAKQVSLNRVVALKMILKGELASEADVRRFRQEAEAAANLDHPNIVPIYEVGEHEGQQYFSMKLIDTTTALAMEPRDIALRLMKVARAVHHAHQRGILHRDLKPSNILVDRAGEPHVADFGLAKKVEGGENATRSGAIVGTPAYMAPEQARAEPSLTTAVDVYSLGAILYEWLTGRPPFRGDDPLSTLMQVVQDEPTKPRSVNGAIHPDLETICLKCLEKDPAKRYPSAEALADDLGRWLHGEPIEARPAGMVERLLKWSKRRPAAAALVAGTVAGLVLFVAGLLWALDREHQRAQSERGLREQAVDAKTVAEKAESATRDQVVRFQVRRGIEHLDQRDDFFALLWFAQALKSESPESPGLEAHRLRLSLLLQQLPRLRAYIAEPKTYFTDFAFTPDGKHLRTLGYHEGFRRWDVDGGASLGDPIPIKPKSSNSGRFVGGRLIADGELALFEAFDKDDRQITSLWDAKDGEQVFSEDQFKYPAGDRVVLFVTPAPARWLKQTHRKKEVTYEVLDLRTMKPIHPPLKVEEGLGTPSIGPGGNQLAFLAEKTKGNDKRFELHHYDLSTGKPMWPAILVAESGVVGLRQFRHLHFSPDGRRLLTDLDADWRRRVRLWDARKGELLTPEMLPAYPSIFEYEPFSAESKWFFVEEHQVGFRAYSYGKFGIFGEPIRPPGSLGRVVHNPKGDSLATVSGNTTTGRQAGAEGSVIGHWSPAGPLQHPYLHLPSRLDKMRFSPDGNQLACLTDDRRVFVWDMTPRGFTVPPDLPETHEGEGLGFSADGKWVVVGTTENRKDKKGSIATLRVFDTATGKPVSPIIAPYNPESTTYRGFLPEKVAISPDGKRLATLCEGRGKPQELYLDVRVWDVATGEPITPPIVGKGATRNLGIIHHGFAFSPDGRWLYAKLNDAKFGTVYETRVWDAQTGKLFDPGVPYDFAAFSADGSRVLLAENEGNFLRFDPKLKKIQPRPARIHDVRTGQPLGPPIDLPQCWVNHASFSPDGERVALETDDPGARTTHVFDVRTSKPVAGPFAFSRTFDRPFSPDGRRIVCANRYGKVQVFDAATGEPRSPVIHLAGECANAEFAANGLALVTQSDGKVQLWDSRTGAPLAPPIPSKGSSLSDDRKLTVRTSAYTARFFDLTPLTWPTDDIVRLAELLAGHRIDDFSNLTPLSSEEVGGRWSELWPRYLKQLAKGCTP